MLELDKHLHCLERGGAFRGRFILPFVNGDIGLVLGVCLVGRAVGCVEGGETGEERIHGADLNDPPLEDERCKVSRRTYKRAVHMFFAGRFGCVCEPWGGQWRGNILDRKEVFKKFANGQRSDK